MSSERKRLRNLICRDSINTSTGVPKSNQSWGKLPLELAVDIYCFLPMNDKHNMALTCKFWLAAFRHPRIWRYSHFVFTSNKPLTKQIPGEVLYSLQYVTIDCSVPRCEVSEEYLVEKTQSLVKFVVGLKKSRNTTLQELNILAMHVIGPHVMSSGFYHHLRTLLALQTKLSRLSLFNAGLTTAQGMKLLTAAGENNARCLKYLNLRNFSSETSPPTPELKFGQLCGTFTNLTELNLSYILISDDLLNNLSGTLKRIIIWNYSFDFSYRRFGHSDKGWKVLVSKCTGLKTEYHVWIQDWDLVIGKAWVLFPSVPLASLHWCSHGGAWNIIRLCFNQLINTFKNGLEHLHVDVGCKFLSAKDVVAVVERCPLLQTFSIGGTPVPLKLISENLAMWRAKRLQTGTVPKT